MKITIRTLTPQHARICAALGTVAACLLAGCKPDPAVDALKQENAMLRKQAQEHKLSDGPLTQPLDAAPIGSLPAAGSGTPPSAGLPGNAGTAAVVPGNTGGGAQPGGIKGKPAPEGDAKAQLPATLPDYPGAVPDTLAGIKGTADKQASGISLHMLISSDPLDAVVAFYDKKLTRNIEDPMHAGSWIYRHPTRAERGSGKSRQVRLSEAQADGSMRAVLVREDNGKTYIELMQIAATVKDVPGTVTTTPPADAPATGTAPDPLAPPSLLPQKSGGR